MYVNCLGVCYSTSMHARSPKQDEHDPAGYVEYGDLRFDLEGVKCCYDEMADGRTPAIALCIALDKMGYKTFHMSEVSCANIAVWCRSSERDNLGFQSRFSTYATD